MTIKVAFYVVCFAAAVLAVAVYILFRKLRSAKVEIDQQELAHRHAMMVLARQKAKRMSDEKLADHISDLVRDARAATERLAGADGKHP